MVHEPSDICLEVTCVIIVYISMPGGKNTKISDDRFERLLSGMRLGLSRREACRRAGLSTGAVTNWYRRQEVNGRAKFLCREIDRAEAEGEGELLEVVRKNPNSAMTLLARKYPERYGRQRDEPGLIGGAGNITIKQLNVMITEARADGNPESLIAATGIGEDFNEGSSDSGIGKELADETIEATGTSDELLP